MADTQNDAELHALVTQMQVELLALRLRVQRLEQQQGAALPPAPLGLDSTSAGETRAARPPASASPAISAPPPPVGPPPIPDVLQASAAAEVKAESIIAATAPAAMPTAQAQPLAAEAGMEPPGDDEVPPPPTLEEALRLHGRPAQPRPADPPFDWREKLRALRLWPPADGAEGALGAWWASRLGMLMALIGLVSFSAYMQVSPAIRFLELLAAALAITAAGWRLERSSPAFGRVVFAGGLAALYFTSFAAHAVPATRIIASPIAGTLLQAVVAAGLLGLARLRRAPGLAVLMLGFGYLAGMFGIYAGMRPEGLLIGCGFALIALALHLRGRWPAPLLVAMPLTHLLYLLLAWGYWLGGAGAGAPLWIVVGYPAAMLALFAGADLLRALDGAAAATAHEPLPGGWDLHDGALLRVGRRVALLANSTLALAGAWPVMFLHHHAWMHLFYFLFAALYGAASVAWFVQGRGDGVAQAYGFKASALAVLGVVAWLDGLARWVAVFAESWLMALAARRTRWRIYYVAAVLAWFAALALCALWITSVPLGGPVELSPYRWPGALLFALAFGSAALMAALERWFRVEPAGTAETESDDDPSVTAFVLKVLVGAAMLALIKLMPATSYLPATLMLMAALVMAGSRLFAAREPWVGTLPLLPLAYIDYCFGVSLGNGLLLVNLALLVLPGVGAVAWLLAAPGVDAAAAHSRRQAARIALGLALVALLVYLLRMHSLAVASIGALVLGWGLLLAGTWRGRHAAAQLALLPLLLLPLALMLVAMPSITRGPLAPGPEWLQWLGLPLGYGLALLATGWPRHRELLERGRWLETSTALVWAGVAYATWTLVLVLDRENLPAALPLAALLMLQAAWREGHRALRLACLMPAGLGFLTLLGLWIGDSSTPLLARGLLCALALLGYGLCVAMQMRRADGNDEEAERASEIFAAALTAPALLAALGVLLGASGVVHFFVTASWSLAAIVVFVAGLALRLRGVRTLALGTFGLAILRVFAVDARSAFDRIVAFIALGALLLVVGFLYHRFGARLRGGATARSRPPSQ